MKLECRIWDNESKRESRINYYRAGQNANIILSAAFGG